MGVRVVDPNEVLAGRGVAVAKQRSDCETRRLYSIVRQAANEAAAVAKVGSAIFGDTDREHTFIVADSVPALRISRRRPIVAANHG